MTDGGDMWCGGMALAACETAPATQKSPRPLCALRVSLVLVAGSIPDANLADKMEAGRDRGTDRAQCTDHYRDTIVVCVTVRAYATAYTGKLTTT